MRISLILLLFVAASCGPHAKLRLANKLIASAERDGVQWHSDTLYETIEIPVPEVVKDTIFQSAAGDTVRIQKERLSIEYVQLPGNKVYIRGECKSDTVRQTIYKTVTKSIFVPPKKSKFKWWYLLIAFAAGALTFAIFRR